MSVQDTIHPPNEWEKHVVHRESHVWGWFQVKHCGLNCLSQLSMWNEGTLGLVLYVWLTGQLRFSVSDSSMFSTEPSCGGCRGEQPTSRSWQGATGRIWEILKTKSSLGRCSQRGKALHAFISSVQLWLSYFSMEMLVLLCLFRGA